MDLVIVTAPKPPGSRTLISPPGAVFEMAPAKVLHGAVRLHGLTSSPTPDTQVRVACALAGTASTATTAAARSGSSSAVLLMGFSPLVGLNSRYGVERSSCDAQGNWSRLAIVGFTFSS